MHNAPAVSYPVARSPLAAFFMGVMWVAGTSPLIWAALLPSQPAWRLIAAIALCLVVGLAAFDCWWKSPIGALRWDQSEWTFTPFQVAPGVSVAFEDMSVALDFQEAMLVHFRLPSGQGMWLWLEGRGFNRNWRMLRRAIYARPGNKDAAPGQRINPAESYPA